MRTHSIRNLLFFWMLSFSSGIGSMFLCDAQAQTVPFPAVPLAQDDALIFAPGADAILTVQAANAHGEPARLVAFVRAFRGTEIPTREVDAQRAQGETVISYGVRNLFRIDTLPDQTLGQGEARLTPGFDGKVTINLGRLPEGFHMLEFSLVRDGAETKSRKYPLAVFEVPEERPYTHPTFPFGVYGRFMQYRRTEPPIVWKTYVHAMANDLHRNHINAVVATGGFDPGELEIYNRYGVAGVSRGGKQLDHPGVLASLHGDEPKVKDLETYKARFDAIRAEYPGKIITTCMVGEGMGLGSPSDPVQMWRVLEPNVRLFRWYGVKKHHYDALYTLYYKGVLALSSVLRIAETTDPTPWWIILPTFGGDQPEAYFQNPSPAQLSSMIHLSLAHGAEGFLMFIYQIGLVDAVTLAPRDGKLAELAKFGRLIERHGDLLKTREYASLDVRCDSPVLELVPVRVQDRLALYAVNKDAGRPVSTRVAIRDVASSLTRARDLFTGAEAPIEAQDGVYHLAVELPAGGGALLDLGVAASTVAEVPKAQQHETSLDDRVAAAVRDVVARDGAAVLALALDRGPCAPGDGIGLLGPDDPREGWEQRPDSPKCLSWSGKLRERTAEGYLPLVSALRLAEAAATRASSDVPDVETDAKAEDVHAKFWAVYPDVAVNGTSPEELRAMLHLALAFSGQAVLIPDSIGPELAAVVKEVSELARANGQTLAGLRHAGLDIRCKDPRIVALPRSIPVDGTAGIGVYVVNTDPDHAVTAHLMLRDQVWNWTTAHDIFAKVDLDVSPADADGNLVCSVPLEPGEGRLILTDAATKKKR